MTVRTGFLLFGAAVLTVGCGGDDGGSTSSATDTATATATESTGGSTGMPTSGATDSGSTGGTTGSTDGTGGTGTTGGTAGSTGGQSGPVVRVVYRHDGNVADLNEVYAVDVVDDVPGDPVQFSDPLFGDQILSSLIGNSPDQRWLTYEVSSNTASSRNLYVVDLFAPTPQGATLVSVDPAPAPGIVIESGFSPQSDLLAFVSGPDTSGGGLDIYLTPLGADGPGTTVRLNPAVTSSDGVGGFAFSPDGARIAYGGSFDNGIDNIWIQDADPANPGAPVQVSANTDANVSVYSAEWFNDDDWLVYKADVDDDGVNEVFAVNVSAAPGTPIMLDPGDTGIARGPGMAPDMRGYAYWLGNGTSGDMYFATFDGVTFGAPVLVNTLGAGGDVYSKEFVWSPDSNWLFYAAEHNTAGTRELFAVDMSGGTPTAPVQVNGALLPATEVEIVRMDPSGTHLYYFASQDTMDLELYRVSVAPGTLGTVERVHTQTVNNSTELMFGAGDVAMFSGELQGGGDRNLFLADLAMTPPASDRVNPLHPGQDISFGAQFSASARYIAYSTGVPSVRPIYLVDRQGAGLGTSVQVAPDSATGAYRVIELP